MGFFFFSEPFYVDLSLVFLLYTFKDAERDVRSAVERERGEDREEKRERKGSEEKRQKIEHTLVSVFRTQVSNQGSTFQLHLTVLPPEGLYPLWDE